MATKKKAKKKVAKKKVKKVVAPARPKRHYTPRSTQEDNEKIAALYDSGVSPRELAEAWGCTDKTIRNRAIAGGATMRPVGRPRKGGA